MSGSIHDQKTILNCPGHTRANGVDDGDQLGSYGYNVAGRMSNGHISGPSATRNELGLGGRVFSNDNWRTYTSEPIPENVVKSPGEMILMGDSILINNGFFPLPGMVIDEAPPLARPAGYKDRFDNDVFYDESTYGEAGYGASGKQGYKRRHSARWNVSFCDGHVENLRTAELFSQTSEAILRRCNNDNEPHLN